MLQTWTMPTPTLAGIAERGGSPVETEEETALAVLDRAGYVATLATNTEFEIVRYLRLGEVVSSTTVFESISEEKRTRMGRGRFVTWVTTYTVEPDEVVGRQTFRILKFDPSDGASVSPVRFADLTVGDELPALEVPVTATLIAAGAIATRDFMPVHHDREYAAARVPRTSS